RIRGQKLILPVYQNLPANLLLVEQNGQVFGNLGGFVKIKLDVQIVRGAGATYFGQIFRYAAEILTLGPGSASVFRQDTQINVGLRRIFQEKGSSVVAGSSTRSSSHVYT